MLKRVISRFSPALNLVVGMFSRASGQIVTFLVTLVALGYIGPHEFGAYAIAAAFVTITRALLYTGPFQYIVRIENLRLHSSECLAVSVLLVCVLTTLSITFLCFFGEFFGDASILGVVVQLAPSNFLAAICAWQEAQVLRQEKLKSYYGITTLSEVMSGLVSMGALFAGLGVEALVLQAYARVLLLGAGYAFISPPVVSSRFSFGRAYSVFAWSRPQYVSLFLGQATTYAPDFIIGALLSPAATGIFRAASRITSVVSDVCAQPLRMIALTVFSRLSNSGSSPKEAYVRLVALSCLIAGAALGFLALNIQIAVSYLFGPQWAGIETLVCILCAGRFFSIVGGISGPLLVSVDRQQALVPIQMAMSISLVAGLILFSPYGVMASGIVSSASSALGGLAFIVCAATVCRPDPLRLINMLGSALLPLAVASVGLVAMWTYDGRALATDAGGIVASAISTLIFLVTAATQHRKITLMLKATSPNKSTPRV